jgi:hypothetical protein
VNPADGASSSGVPNVNGGCDARNMSIRPKVMPRVVRLIIWTKQSKGLGHACIACRRSNEISAELADVGPEIDFTHTAGFGTAAMCYTKAKRPQRMPTRLVTCGIGKQRTAHLIFRLLHKGCAARSRLSNSCERASGSSTNKQSVC